MDRETLKSALEQAVRDLKGSGRIKKNEDIVQALKMSKGTFSSYLNGLQTPSRNFVSKFKTIFGIDLTASTEKISPAKDEPEPAAEDYQEKYIKLLEQQVAVLNTAIQNNLAALSGSQQTTLAMLRAHVKNEAMIRAKGDLAKADKEVDNVNRYAFEYQGVLPEKGIVGHSRGKG